MRRLLPFFLVSTGCYSYAPMEASRLQAGESTETIEASIVERSGERILAVPPTSPLKSVAAVLLLVMVAAGGAAFAMLRRWKARSQIARPADDRKKQALSNEESKKLEDRLDAELQAMDE